MVMISVGQRWIHPRRRRHAALHQRPAFVLLAPLPVAVVTLRTAQSATRGLCPFNQTHPRGRHFIQISPKVLLTVVFQC